MTLLCNCQCDLGYPFDENINFTGQDYMFLVLDTSPRRCISITGIGDFHWNFSLYSTMLDITSNDTLSTTTRFFGSNRPEYPHPVSSELENSGIRVAVGDCSVTERQRWRSPYQTGKTVHVHAKHYKHNEDGRTVQDVCSNDSVPLSHSRNVVTRIGKHTHTHRENQTVFP